MFNYFKAFLGYHLGNQRGQGMVEYVLIIGFVALVLIAVVTLFGTTIQAKFQELIDAM